MNDKLKKQIKNLLGEAKTSSYFNIIKKDKELYNDIISNTTFLKKEKVTFSEKLYIILNDIIEEPKCYECLNIEPNFVKFINFNNGYRKYCSLDCQRKSKTVKNLREQTMKERYNVVNSMKSDNIKEKLKQTNIKKYGVEYPTQSKIVKDKTKQTNIDKYGVDNVMKLKKFKDKTKQTNIDKYGVDNVMKLKEFKDKYIKTNIDKYGVDYPMKSEIVKKKRKETNIDKYGVSHFSQSKKYKNKRYKKFLNKFFIISKNNNIEPLFDIKNYKGSYYIENNKKYPIQFDFKCLKCNHHFKETITDGRYINFCPKCFLKNGTSFIEKEIEDYLKTLNISFISNSRNIIPPYELDFYFESKKTAIEFNGLYYHSYNFLNKKELKNKNNYIELGLEPNKGKNFHLLKTLLTKEKDINLFHINEDEWLEKKEIVKSMINNKLNINSLKLNARDCEILEVNNNDKNIFLNNNHIQGEDISKIRLGLYLKKDIINNGLILKKGTLVSIMTFGKKRFKTKEKSTNNKEFELLRFANKINFSVRGSASKLFKYFLNNYTSKNDNIVSFADLRYSNGNIYNILGFDYIYTTSPQYKYIKGNRTFNRQFFQKKKIKKYYNLYINNDIDDINYGKIKYFNDDMTENELMLLNSYNKIYDSGQMKFVYTCKS